MADGALPAELKTQLDGFHKTLSDIRAKQDEVDKEVKKLGEADPLHKASIEKIQKALGEQKDEFNTLFKKVTRPVLSPTQLDAKAKALETKANREFALWTGQDLDRIDHAKTTAERNLYASAFNKMVRRGEKALTPEETKALSVGSAPDLGFYVEPARADQIITKLFETSEMRAIASAITISTSSIKYPIDRDEAGFEWVGETQTRSETTTPQVGELEIPVHELSAMPKATQNILDDAAIDVEAWLDGKISDRFARGENNAFVLGNGTNKPKGFLTYPTSNVADAAGTRPFGTLQYIATGVDADWAASNKADILLNLIYAFKSGYRSSLRWAMTRTTLGEIRLFKDGQGNYIAGPRLSDQGLIEQIFTYPVSEFADMPETVSNALAVALGDFRRAYQIVDRQGIRQLRDAYTQKPHTLFYTTKRVGGAVIDSDALKLIKFGVA